MRLEAGLCLYGHELDLNKTPVEANLKWAISKERLSNGGFVGSDKIINQIKEGAKQIRVGINPEGRLIAREKTKIFNEIEAEHDGTVYEILIENEDPVEFGQPIIEIKQ